MENKATMTYIGMDNFDRPVYKDENGNLWKDADPRSHVPPLLCSVLNNDFYGEPDVAFHGKAKFIPRRVTW